MRKISFLFAVFLCLCLSARLEAAGIRVVASGAEKGIELRAMAVASETAGRLARTTVDMTFFNPNPRVLIGELEFPLSEGQTVTEFALEMEDGELRYATAVDRAKGREAFEEVTRMRIDPALLEADRGGGFRMRVYPLNPGATRRVRVVFTESLREGEKSGVVRYVLPLTCEGTVRDFSFAMTAGGVREKAEPHVSGPVVGLKFARSRGVLSASFRGKNVRLSRSIEIGIPLGDKGTTVTGERNGTWYFYAEVPVGDILKGTERAEKPKTVGLLWDASLSGGERDRAAEFAVLDAWFGKIGDVKVRLQVARDAAEPMKEFAISGGDWGELRRELAETVYDGATNLGAFRTDDGCDTYLLFTDGRDNYGAEELKVPKVPLYALAASQGANWPKLRALANGTGGSALDIFGIVARSEALEKAVAALTTRKPLLVKIAGNGISDCVYGSPEVGDATVSVAGVLNAAKAHVTLVFALPGGSFRDVKFDAGENVPASILAPHKWASMRLAKLEADRNLSRGAIRRLGLEFGMATSETSLIVLDRVEDYVRYDIEPPQKLRKAFDALRARTGAQRGQPDKTAWVLRMWQAREQWWNTDFPKGELLPPPAPGKHVYSDVELLPSAVMEDSISMEIDAETKRQKEIDEKVRQYQREVQRREPEGAPLLGSINKLTSQGAGKRETSAPYVDEIPASRPIRRGQPYTQDSPCLRRLKGAAADDLYRIYLDERPDYGTNPAFYTDTADVFLSQGLDDLALRVLSNLAEIAAESREDRRTLGCKLMDLKRPELAVRVFRDVLEMAEEEPTAYRDLGLAYAAAGDRQRAIETLYTVVTRTFPRTYPGMEIVVLTEINEIVAGSPAPLDVSMIDSRFLKSMPLGLRAVLTWNADNVDALLRVIDPNGQTASFVGYGASTWQGGLISGGGNGLGYGPEEFALRKPKPGKYRVEAQVVADRRQTQSAPPTLSVTVFENWGTKDRKAKSVTLRAWSHVSYPIGEFEIE